MKLRDSITTLIASNFDLVHMKSKFVEGIRIEKTRVGFCSKLRNPFVMGNNPQTEFSLALTFDIAITKDLFI